MLVRLGMVRRGEKEFLSTGVRKLREGKELSYQGPEEKLLFVGVLKLNVPFPIPRWPNEVT